MAYNRLPSNTPAILRAAGLTVKEAPGWRGRGRPASTGNLDPVATLCHHTATGPGTSDASLLRLLTEGRSDLPGPLCHFALMRDGTVWIVADGRANHAGAARASGTVAAGDGNALYWGIEAANAGTGERWPKAQYDAYVLLCAALCVKVTGNSAQTVRAHKETSVTGKIDPAGPTPYGNAFDMDAFRDRVAAQIKKLEQGPAKKSPIGRAIVNARRNGYVERVRLLRKARSTKR